MADLSALCLSTQDTALLVVDFQEKFGPAMPAEALAVAERNTALLLRAAALLTMRVVVTEQYPKGLGPTVPALLELLPEGTPTFEKTVFSAADAEGVVACLQAAGARSIVVAGLEAHVCVLQTVVGLRQQGFNVWVAEDAVLSRASCSREAGLRLCTAAGAQVATTETILFMLLKKAGTPDFKTISGWVR